MYSVYLAANSAVKNHISGLVKIKSFESISMGNQTLRIRNEHVLTKFLRGLLENLPPDQLSFSSKKKDILPQDSYEKEYYETCRDQNYWFTQFNKSMWAYSHCAIVDDVDRSPISWYSSPGSSSFVITTEYGDVDYFLSIPKILLPNLPADLSIGRLLYSMFLYNIFPNALANLIIHYV